MTSVQTSAGFTLVASLLLLLVLTLLGVSSMTTVSMQERMAKNLKEKERASEASEMATRGAERFITQLLDIPDPSNTAPTNVWNLDGPTGGIPGFLTDSNWANAIDFTSPPFDTGTLIGTGSANLYAARPQSYTEEALFQPYSLDPEDLAQGNGLFYYRVTGRGVGGDVTAVSIIQSMFMNRYK